MKIVIIYGTSTDVGKTFFTTKYIKHLKNKGKKVFAIKPVLSGALDKDFGDNDTVDCDASLIYKALNPKEHFSFKELCFARLKTPASPDIAASLEGFNLKLQDVIEFCKKTIAYCKKNNYDYLLIETAGGFASPIAKDGLCIDLSLAIKPSKSIIVTAPYLGAISHLLSAYHLHKFDAVVFNYMPQKTTPSNICHLDYCKMVCNSMQNHLKRHLGRIKIINCKE